MVHLDVAANLYVGRGKQKSSRPCSNPISQSLGIQSILDSKGVGVYVQFHKRKGVPPPVDFVESARRALGHFFQ